MGAIRISIPRRPRRPPPPQRRAVPGGTAPARWQWAIQTGYERGHGRKDHGQEEQHQQHRAAGNLPQDVGQIDKQQPGPPSLRFRPVTAMAGMMTRAASMAAQVSKKATALASLGYWRPGSGRSRRSAFHCRPPTGRKTPDPTRRPTPADRPVPWGPGQRYR